MDIRQLRYFIAAAEEAHLGRAAERLHLSQPALTRQIQLMEQSVGAALFTRTPRGVALTEVGRTLLRGARQVDQMLDQTLALARQAARGELGALSLGVYGTAQFDYLPRLLARLKDSHPEVQVTLQHQPPEQLLTALRQGRLLALFERRLLDDADIESHVVQREPSVVALHERHPLARLDEVPMDALRGEPLIIGRHLLRPRGTVDFCREHGFEPTVAAESVGMTSGVVMVAGGVGSAVVPRCMTRLQLPGVVYRPLTGRHDTAVELYCYHAKGETSPLLAVVLDAVRDLRAADEADDAAADVTP